MMTMFLRVWWQP